MTRGVLLDANIVIGAFDGERGNEAHEKARVRLEELLADDKIKVAITPLIRYEVMRGVAPEKVDSLDASLSVFHEFDITGKEAVRAAEIFRLAREAGKKLDKHSFDVLHFACAQEYDLELASQDGDMAIIAALATAKTEAETPA